MRIIVAGSRHLELDEAFLDQAVRATGLVVTELLSGACRGVDQTGEQWAAARAIPVVRFPADWRRFGRAAGPYRNMAMLARAAQGPEAGALLAFWDGRSRGTRHIIEAARHSGLAVFVHYIGAAD